MVSKAVPPSADTQENTGGNAVKANSRLDAAGHTPMMQQYCVRFR